MLIPNSISLIRFVALSVVILTGLLLSEPPTTARAQQNLLDSTTREMLHEELSGELAKEHVIEITRHHRIQGSRGYRDAANYVLAQLQGYGFSAEDAYIESYKSDGKVHYQTWQSPSGWDIEWAELRMLEPYEERIVGYPEIAMSLITYSNPGDETADLVWVGQGTSDSDYHGKDVKDKFVLATGYGGSVHRLAVLKYGARAVVCYLDDDRAQEYPDMLQYTGMWPKTDELEHVTFGFNLTNRQGEKLRQLLEAGKRVVLRGQVKGIGLEPYFMDVVVAHIRGSKHADEELVFSAHLDHPKESANDNASGSAALLDIARTFKRLVDEDRLPAPERSLRLIWVPEWYGTMAYIDKHPELAGPALGGTFLANFNMDMVGEHLELLHSKLILTRTPDAAPSVLNDVIENMAAMVDRMDIRTPRGSLSAFNYRITPYSGGSDHMMFIDRKIPGVMFSHSPDYTHHTSEDTPDKVDPVELERCELIAAGAAWYLANLTAEQATKLAYLTAANSMQRLGLALHKAIALIPSASNGKTGQAWAEGENVLQHALHRETATLSSITHFNSDARVRQVVEAMQVQLRRQYESHLSALQAHVKAQGFTGETAPAIVEEWDTRIPVRVTRGPLAFDLPASKLKGERKAWYSSAAFTLSGAQRFELVNFIDGERNITRIRNALSAEFEPVQPETISRYIEDLVAVGVLQWKDQ